MTNYKSFSRIIFTVILIALAFYFPFILFGLYYRVSTKIAPFFITIILLYIQLILPIATTITIKIINKKVSNSYGQIYI